MKKKLLEYNNSISRVALITSAINPKINTNKIEVVHRMDQTVKSLSYLYYQKIFDKVILIDGTGFNFSLYPVFSSYNKEWLHCYSFDQDQEQVTKYGYGFGELLIYDEFLRIFPDLKSNIYKLSGRYIITNLDEIATTISSQDNYFFTYYPRFLELRKYVHTSLYKISSSNLSAMTNFSKNYIIANPHTPLELAVCKWILCSNLQRNWLKSPLPCYVGVGGHSGMRLENKYFPYNILSKLDVFPLMGFSI